MEIWKEGRKKERKTERKWLAWDDYWRRWHRLISLLNFMGTITGSIYTRSSLLTCQGPSDSVSGLTKDARRFCRVSVHM